MFDLNMMWVEVECPNCGKPSGGFLNRTENVSFENTNLAHSEEA